MSPAPDRERWLLLDRLFDQALELPEEAREAFIRDASPDAETEAELRRLLAADAGAGSFLEEAPEIPAEALEGAVPGLSGGTGAGGGGAPESHAPGERVGPYRLVRPLGRGGMASVWLAERVDGGFQQEVAVKLIRRGLDTEDVLRRFRGERQILSALAHPDVARLLDGGTTAAGEPYLVMERVDGRPVTEYCDAHGLGVRERVRLLARVGGTVAYAHRALVVHRDLKPSNILVTDEGAPKLLDFGIAKLLDPSAWPGESSGATRTGTHLLTPEYASPEQIRGEPVTTASDIFQLGVLLYRLLTGVSPFPEVRSGGSSLAARLSRDAGPVERPSAAVRRAAASHAAAEEAARARGTTPSGLARALEGELDLILMKALDEDPARRYPTAEALVADLERFLDGRPVEARAPTLAYRTRKYLSRNPWVAPVAALFLLALAGYLVTVSRNAAELARERDRAQTEARSAQAVTDFLTGLFGGASPYSGGRSEMPVRELLARGARRVLDRPVDDPLVQARLVEAVARAHVELELHTDARDFLREALEAGAGGDVMGEDGVEAAVSLQEMLGLALVRTGDYAEARALLEEAVVQRGAVGDSTSLAVIRNYMTISEAHFMEGNREQGTAVTDRWLPLTTRLDGGHDAVTLMGLDRRFHLAGGAPAYGEPEALAREKLAVARSLYNDTTPVVEHALDDLGSVLSRRGRFRESEPVTRRQVELAEALYGRRHLTTTYATESLALILGELGEDLDEALALQQEALEVRIRNLGESHIIIPITRARVGKFLKLVGRLDEASAALEAAIAPSESQFGATNPLTAVMVEDLGHVRVLQGRLAEAEGLLARAGAVFAERYTPADLNRVRWAKVMAELRTAQGRHADAEAILLEAEAALAAEADPVRERQERVWEALARVNEAWGRDAEAERWRGRIRGEGGEAP